MELKLPNTSDKVSELSSELISLISYELPVSYNPSKKELIINIPDSIENIKINGIKKILVDNNFEISVNGQLDLTTNDGKLCLDSVNNSIHFNSRESLNLKDLPESIEYLEQMKKKKLEHKKSDCNCSGNDLFNRLLLLENAIKNLEEHMYSF